MVFLFSLLKIRDKEKAMTFRNACIAVLSIILCAGCTPMSDLHGNFVDPFLINQLQVGSTSKSRVKDILGAPSSTSTFNDDIWFYIGQRTNQYAFLKPRVVAHKVVALSFDQQNTLDAIAVRGLDEYTPISPINRATPSAGKKLSILEQLIGNVGKYNTNKNPAGN